MEMYESSAFLRKIVMGRKHPKDNYSLNFSFKEPEPVVVVEEGVTTHLCFWYQSTSCSTRSKTCKNLDNPGCTCPIKPKE
jgi:hypothetical protein